VSRESWSDNRIALVGAQIAKFKDRPAGLHWDSLKAAPEKFRAVLRDADMAMTAIEDDNRYTPAGKMAAKRDVAKATFAKLDAIKIDPSVQRRLDKLAEKMKEASKPDGLDPAMAAEIRSMIRADKAPAMAAIKHRGDPKIVAAILSAPPALSGLTSEEQDALRRSVEGSTPEGQEVAQINEALAIGDDATNTARFMLAERARMTRGADGTWK
jgi:hypothetical protein